MPWHRCASGTLESADQAGTYCDPVTGAESGSKMILHAVRRKGQWTEGRTRLRVTY
jgi:hypothetical protein